MDLEDTLIHRQEFGLHVIPPEALSLYNQETADLVPTAIGCNPELGYYVLQSSGQGPYVIWSEKNNSSIFNNTQNLQQ